MTVCWCRFNVGRASDCHCVCLCACVCMCMCESVWLYVMVACYCCNACESSLCQRDWVRHKTIRHCGIAFEFPHDFNIVLVLRRRHFGQWRFCTGTLLICRNSSSVCVMYACYSSFIEYDLVLQNRLQPAVDSSSPVIIIYKLMELNVS